jgi:hypothetical protein
LLCFRPWRYSEANMCSCRRWIQRVVCPSRFLKLISQVSAERSLRRWTLVRRGTDGNFPVFSQLQVFAVGCCRNLSRPCSTSYCNRQLLASLRPVLGTALFQSRRYSHLCPTKLSFGCG